jgi:2-amino-4-hydroxy-6-hydroxymethyldihydropteridine diphosphokinase
MSLAYLILGGNRGNRQEIISTAIDLLARQIGSIHSMSALYESESWGFSSELFINQIVVFQTSLSPEEVLDRCLETESRLGRVRSTGKYEARTIDIDILYFDGRIIESERLTVPHPRISARKFVLLPLAEIAPELDDPVTGMTVAEMLQNCMDTSRIWRVEN